MSCWVASTSFRAFSVVVWAWDSGLVGEYCFILSYAFCRKVQILRCGAVIDEDSVKTSLAVAGHSMAFVLEPLGDAAQIHAAFARVPVEPYFSWGSA